MKKVNYVLIITIATVLIAVLSGCGSSKGYQGAKMDSEELARIRQGDNKLRVKGKKTSESAYLIKVDTLTVGSYMKGFPKYTDVLPGEKTVEIRHFQQWNDRSATAGAMFGLIGASIAESNNPHSHYKLTFSVDKGKEYVIMPITDETGENAAFYVINISDNDTIQPKVVQIVKDKKKEK